ncbi:hypothetical protein [Microbacterium paludicola]|uniref:hypothetical protein n=1 Tax=Microbacterium paludicola TaxID=300019 RepID=UPI0031D4DC00
MTETTDPPAGSTAPQRVLRWVLGAVVVFLAVLGSLALLGAMKVIPEIALFGNESEERNAQVLTAVSREEQVVLLSLGIEGIDEKTDRTTFLGVDIPGSERATFVQYSFSAKLGIEGGDVRIDETGEGEYRITVPEFVFIGHDDEHFELITERNGALSWITPEIDELEMVRGILSDDVKAQYVADNEALLREQTESFYRRIVTGIDPEIELTFVFEDSAGSRR